ncbi:MAG TPA: DUF6263 family protein [Coleofasciculaceae cyanobacterium]
MRSPPKHPSLSQFMKKLVFASSVCLLLAGGRLEPASALPVRTQVPFFLAQSNNSTLTPSTAPAQVELLSAGAEPRQELRLSPIPNSKEVMTITTNMEAMSSVEGQAMPKFPVPTSVMKMETTITKVDPNGDIHAEFSYTDADIVADPSVPPEIVKAMQSALNQLVGFKGSFITDNRGHIKSGNFVLPEGGDPMVRQLIEQVSNSLEQFSSPLPAEPIGIGAKWRVSSALDIAGMKLSQNAIYELVDLKDNVATLNVTIDQQASTQRITSPGLPPEASLTLKSLNSQGQGQIIMSLDSALPSRADLSISSQTEMDVQAPNNGEEMTIETNLLMQMIMESQRQN